MDDVSRLACLCLCSTLLSVSRRANRRAVSHKYFQSTRWKRFVMGNDVLYSTPASVGQTKPGRNSTTQSRMCSGKDTRGYLSARSSTRCILVANCSISSPLCITLDIWKSLSSKRHSVSNKSQRKEKDPDLVRLSTRSPGREGMPTKISVTDTGTVSGGLCGGRGL